MCRISIEQCSVQHGIAAIVPANDQIRINVIYSWELCFQSLKVRCLALRPLIARIIPLVHETSDRATRVIFNDFIVENNG